MKQTWFDRILTDIDKSGGIIREGSVFDKNENEVNTRSRRQNK